MTARPVHIERIGSDVFLLRVGDITIALTHMELAALRHEVEAAIDG